MGLFLHLLLNVWLGALQLLLLPNNILSIRCSLQRQTITRHVGCRWHCVLLQLFLFAGIFHPLSDNL